MTPSFTIITYTSSIYGLPMTIFNQDCVKPKIQGTNFSAIDKSVFINDKKSSIIIV